MQFNSDTGDTDNTGDAVDAVSYAVNYSASSWNDNNIEQYHTGILNAAAYGGHLDIIKFLKQEHSFTYGFANLVALKARKSDADSFENKDDLVDLQYKGKEHFRPLYDKLVTKISEFGNNIEIAPKKAYVSLRSKKQFAILNPATKSRFEIGLIIKDQKGEGILEEVKTSNSMCSHKINLSSIEQIDSEVLNWVKVAYKKSN